MKRPEPNEYHPFYQSYIDRTRGADALQNLQDSADMLLSFLVELPPEKTTYAYADSKWTIHQLLQHLNDCELIFAYRALWIARSGEGKLTGFDENAWADRSLEALPTWQESVEQFKYLRNFSLSMFHSFPEKLMDKTRMMDDFETTLRSIPFIMAGHTYHHIHILKTRYR